ncbi:MAG: hypothetical protein U0043_05430 [Streptococcus sp.]
MVACILPKDHIVFTIEKAVNALEDSHFQSFYHDFGRPSYHPCLNCYFLRPLFLCLFSQISLVVRLERMMVENLAGAVLDRTVVISYRTINRFRISGMEELIRQLFIDSRLN